MVVCHIQVCNSTHTEAIHVRRPPLLIRKDCSEAAQRPLVLYIAAPTHLQGRTQSGLKELFFSGVSFNCRTFMSGD